MKPLLGIALKVLSALAFTLMSAGIKRVSDGYPTGEIVFFRSAFAIVPLLAWLAWRGDLINSVRTSNLSGHLLRGIISSCGMFSGFVALAYLPLSDAVAIGYASPLMVVVLAALVLHETVRAYRWTAVTVGFLGVLIMLMPHLVILQDDRRLTLLEHPLKPAVKPRLHSQVHLAVIPKHLTRPVDQLIHHRPRRRTLLRLSLPLR